MKLRIKEICDRKGITVRSIAEKVEISVPGLYNIANGKINPSSNTLERIADALDVPLWQLLISPDEINKPTNQMICPECGAKLELRKID